MNDSQIRIFIICAFILGVGITLGGVIFMKNMSVMPKVEFNNQTQTAYNLGFQNGLIYTADYTLKTGNFTYLNNQTIQTMPLMDYCNLNLKQEEK